MAKLDEYRSQLKALDDWAPFLLRNSGLPGPRGNLELAQAVAEETSAQQIEQFLSMPAEQAPENSANVFLVFCGVMALGMQAARGEHANFVRLRDYACDPRWRVREAVAIGLQYVGDANMGILLKEMSAWAKGNWYEKRAVAAALAEPRLLKDPKAAKKVLGIFDKITQDIEASGEPREEAFKVLRQSMGYCWSVAVAASPAEGKALMEKWMSSSSRDVRWIMKENLKKNRLAKMDAKWVERWEKNVDK